MKAFFLLPAFVLVAACSNTEPVKEEAAKTEEATAISYPYTADYSSDFKIGDPNLSKKVLELWKIWEGGNLDEARPYFADSVQIVSSDAVMTEGPTDSVMVGVKAFRAGFKTIETKITAWIPAHSNDKGDDFVLIWGDEKRTAQDGKLDSLAMHEVWVFNKEGKVRNLYQWTQMAPPK